MNIEREASPVRICVTGPESTGKTTLAEALASALGTEWVPEASRLHALDVQRALTSADVEPIARRHVAMAEDADRRAIAAGARYVVLDTDLVSTLVYASHYYDTEPAWVVRREVERRASLYLLCDIDVPWIADGVRDRPAHRGQLLTSFREALAVRRARVVEVYGSERVRLQIALAAVASIGATHASRTAPDP